MDVIVGLYVSVFYRIIQYLISNNINEVIRPVLKFFFYDKISQVQKSIKTQFQFFYQCRFKADLVLYTYVFIYLKVAIK